MNCGNFRGRDRNGDLVWFRSSFKECLVTVVLVCLIDYLFISLFTYLSVYLSIRLSFYQSIYVCLYLSSWLFICLFLSISTYLPTSLFGNGGFGALRMQIFAALAIVIWYT